MVLKVGSLLLVINLNFLLHWDIVNCEMVVDGIVERFVCPELTDKSHADICNVKIRKIKKKNLIKGTITFFHGCDNRCEVDVITYKLQGNEYRLTPYKVKRGKFCDMIMSDPIIVPKLYEGFNIAYECPPRPGNYTGQFEFDFSGVPTFLDGRWKLVCNIYLPNGFMESYEAYAEIHHYYKSG